MIIFYNKFYYFIVLLNIMIGCSNDIHNIRYLKIRYVDDLFKHKNHIYAYILCRCYFNGALIGSVLSIINYFLRMNNLFYFLISCFHIVYLINNYNIYNKITYKDIIAIYGFHTGYINLITY